MGFKKYIFQYFSLELLLILFFCNCCFSYTVSKIEVDEFSPFRLITTIKYFPRIHIPSKNKCTAFNCCTTTKKPFLTFYNT